MAFKLVYLGEGYRMLRRSLRVKRTGFRQYSGDAKEVCRQAIEGCWNKHEQYFMASNGHFCQFWTRDFGLCAEHLIHLGHRDRVVKTLEYALKRFRAQNRITTSISPGGKAFNFPVYAPDSLAFLLKSLKASNARWLIHEHRGFLNQQIQFFYDNAIDSKTGLVRKDRHFSSIKDQALRVSSCYDNVMAAMVKSLTDDLGLHNPFGNCCSKEKIRKAFWKATHFIDDLSGVNLASGDANTFPYWTGLFSEKNMIKSSIAKIRKLGLDKPFPLRYTTHAVQKRDFYSLFARNYEGNSVWMHLGSAYLSVVKKADKKLFEEYVKKYGELIEKYKNYLEVFNPDGSPYSSPFYCCDESMLWASIFLDLIS